MPADVVTLAEVLTAEKIATAAVVSNRVLRRPLKEKGDVGVQQGFIFFNDTMITKEKDRTIYERVAPDTTRAAMRGSSARRRRARTLP
jgi:hypothetical protein